MAKIVSRGDPIEPVYLNNLRVAAYGWGVISGLAVSQKGAGADMSVDVALGVAWIDGTRVTKGSTTNVTITAAHASYDRYDLVVINSSGTISVIDGTAAATSYANDYDLETNNAILLAEVYVPATDTTIEDAQITDKQILSFMEEIEDSIFSIGLEEYSNHLGATDNFTETNTSGNGAASADTTNHEMDLSSGITIVGHGDFITKKTFTIGSKPLVFNAIIQNYVAGAAGHRRIRLGFSAVFDVTTPSNVAMFYHYDGTWYAATASSDSWTNTVISALAGDDIVTIVATSSIVVFYVNGVVVATHTTNIPSAVLYSGAGAIVDAAGATTATSISIDMMGIKAYH